MKYQLPLSSYFLLKCASPVSYVWVFTIFPSLAQTKHIFMLWDLNGTLSQALYNIRKLDSQL
jgi:hypothetical protein